MHVGFIGAVFFQDSIVIVEGRVVVQYVNEKFCNRTGYELTNYLGKSSLEFYPEGRMKRWYAWMKGIHSESPGPEITED